MKRIILLFMCSIVTAQCIDIPTIRIRKQTEEDRALIEKMRPLFFERRNRGALDVAFTRSFFGNVDTQTRLKSLDTALQEPYNGKRVTFQTQDKHRIAGLFFKRDDAPVNILCVQGYFKCMTPTKEWTAPYSQIFPEFNVLSFDWRGYGDSEDKGETFDSRAYRDVLAAIDFLRKNNDKPVVIVSFCLGSAFALKAILEAEEHGLPSADALVLSCSPARMSDMKKRTGFDFPFPLRWLSYTTFGQEFLLPLFVGNIFDLDQCEMLKQITIPIHFEHLMKDRASPISDVYHNFFASESPKKVMLLSDIGRHVRIQTAAPAQYRAAFLQFLAYAGIYTAQDSRK